jgi:uncharacterized ferritin-like protein (DUF455 family)
VSPEPAKPGAAQPAGELRDIALRILLTPELEAKLRPPPARATDERPGPPFIAGQPARPPELAIASWREVRVPPLEGMADPRQRPRIVHALANHELQAVELFAWAILAFPLAPAEFRAGLLRILADEQRHTRWYLERLTAWGVKLGDYPVTGYFWSKVPGLTTPLRFVCAMGLTFENANLDHCADYAGAARAAGDGRTADLLDRVGADEVGHVRFAVRWLEAWKGEGASQSETYRENVTWPLRAALARGRSFRTEPRERAGIDPEFIHVLSEAERGGDDEGASGEG